MKRKSKARRSIEGTPPITKFFKKNPDIKAKALTAVVAIPIISPSKSPVKVLPSQTKAKNNSVHKIDSGQSAKRLKLDTSLNDINLVSQEKVNDSEDNVKKIENEECNVDGILESAHKESEKLENVAKKCLIFSEAESNGCEADEICSLLNKSDTNCSSFTKTIQQEGNVNFDSKEKSDFKGKHSETVDTDQSICWSDNSEHNSQGTSKKSIAKRKDFTIYNCESRENNNVSVIGERCEDRITEEKQLISAHNSSNLTENRCISIPSCDVNTEKTVIDTADCSENSKVTNGSSHAKKDREIAISLEQTDSESKIVDLNEQKKMDSKRREEEYSSNDNASNDEASKSDNLSESDKCDDDEDTSDEELFNPVAFLSDNRVKSEIRTPEKVISPITGSPLTPISPYVAQPKNEGARLKYSLDKLLLEKPKQVEKDKALAKLQLAMQQAIEAGRNAGIEDENTTEREEDDEEVLLPQHKKELEKYKSTDKGFREETHGVNIFPKLCEPVKLVNGCCQPFSVMEATVMDEFSKFIYERSEVEIRELMLGGWITHRYLVQPCPPAALRWLFHILCYHMDCRVVKSSYNALWSMMDAEDSKGTGKKLSWIPTVEDVMRVFNSFGANVMPLLADVSSDIHGESLKMLCESEAVEEEMNEQKSSFFPLANFNRLIQFVTLCFDQYPERYRTEEIEQLVLFLFCLCLDSRMEICQHDIKTCLQALYSAVMSDHWIEVAIKMSSVVHRINVHHRNKLRIVHVQPYTSRGRAIKRLSALQIMASLLNNDAVSDVTVFIQSEIDVNKDHEITNTLQTFRSLELLLDNIDVSDDTDYYQLYTIIELLDVVVGAEDLQPREKAIVEKIVKKLRLLHSEIKDPRAMFISRSKVKDLILRTITKFSYMAQGKKETEKQKSITKFFVEGKSGLHIETLEDSEIIEEDEEEEEDIESQASQASSYILYPLSQNAEYSDDESLAGK